MRKPKTIKPINYRKYAAPVAFILLFAIIGIVLLHGSKAAGPYASVEPEGGTLSGATSVTDNSASNNSYVKFGTESSGGGGTGAELVLNGHSLTANGAAIKLRGVAVWGLADHVTVNGSTAQTDYANRQLVASTIKAWGGNVIRLRVLGCDYNSQAYLSNSTELQEIQDWQTAAQANGLYLQIAAWDSSDCSSYGYSGANWASNYSEAFPMFTAIINKLGPTNPWVIYEPFNEPNQISESSWLSAMISTEQEFRNNGYKGILILDTDGWSHVYNDADMTTLENDDAGLSGMNGKNQIIFAKHDYADEGYSNPGSGFDSSYWPNNNDGTSTWDFSKHVVMETEFGNYNNIGNGGTYEYLPWSQGAANWFAQEVNNGTVVGAEAFVWNWVDDNTITNHDDVTPTTWGGYVKNNLLGAIN